MKSIIFNIFGDPDNSSASQRPVGGHRIAHYLRADYDWDVEVVDYARWFSLDELKQLVSSRYDSEMKWIGFSHLFSHWDDTFESFAKWIKETYPEVVLIAGSAAFPQYTSSHIDYYVRGFGEKAIALLLEYVFSNGPRPVFLIVDKHKRKIIDANDQYPSFPMRSLMVKYQKRDFLSSDDWLAIETARGCKFECDFCNFPVLGVKGDYSRDADDFREQVMDAYDRWGIKNYTIADETFNDRTEKITKYADIVEKLSFDPWFSAFIRADLLVSRPRDREELTRMKVRGHWYGIETFNHETGKIIGKGMHPDRMKQGILDIKDYMIKHNDGLYRGTISFIVGLPKENFESLNRTKQWITENWKDQSAYAYCLELERLDLVTDTKPSKMSLDYAKYSYREKNLNEIRDPQKILPDRITVPKFRENLLVWENEHMDYYQADQWTRDWIENSNKNGLRCSNFQIGNFLGFDGNIKKILEVPVRDTIPGAPWAQEQKKLTNAKAMQYIKNKLEWSDPGNKKLY